MPEHSVHCCWSLIISLCLQGLAKFFHNGDRLRKDAIADSIRKVKDILLWFEGQRLFHFYASSLLFVYEGDQSGQTSDAPKAGRGSGGVMENNNNHVHVLSDTRGPRARDCGGGCRPVVSHGNPIVGEEAAMQKDGHQGSLEPRFNGNETKSRGSVEGRIPNRYGSEAGQGQVEVRMIDFAHVFQSETRDDGYIHGLMNLLLQLQLILDK